MGKRRTIACVIVFMLGLIALFSVIGSPRLASLHGADILRLVGSGMCFGAGIGLIFGRRKFPDE